MDTHTENVEKNARLDVNAYLQRIGYSGSIEPTVDTLRALHRAHHLAVPFENLEIHLGRPIRLDEASLFDKIVRHRRGGFCYEMNGLFAALLRELGFDVTLLSARVTSGEDTFGPEFDHMALLVQLEDRWLADVGFGDSFREPLRLDERGEQARDWSRYLITRDGDLLKLLRRDDDSDWKDQYVFSLQPRVMSDYLEMCHYHQTSPQSHFTKSPLCTLAKSWGRVTLSDMRLIITEGGERREILLAGEDEYERALEENFGVRVDVKRLLKSNR